MEKFVLGSLLLLAQYVTVAQTEFAPAGAKWDYDFFGFWPGYGTSFVQYTGDTVVAGFPCKKISNLIKTNDGSSYTHEIYLHQSGDSLINVLADGQDVYTWFLFKNKMSLGETQVFEYLHNAADTFSVVQIDTVSFGGKPVVRYKLFSQNAFETDLYDRFGPEHGFFEQWLSSPWDGNDYYLRCYYDDSIGLAKVGSEDCVSFVSPVSEGGPAVLVDIYPNPASEILYIGFPSPTNRGAAVLFTNLLGDIVLEQTLDVSPTTVDIADLPPGFYTGILQLGQQKFPLKFVKQ